MIISSIFSDSNGIVEYTEMGYLETNTSEII